MAQVETFKQKKGQTFRNTVPLTWTQTWFFHITTDQQHKLSGHFNSHRSTVSLRTFGTVCRKQLI